jgi:transcriptional regulator with XRE-family HTH domain
MRDRSRRRASSARIAGRTRAAYVAARLGNALREARLAAGLRQQDIARLAGIAQSFESRMERGEGIAASIETWAAAAAAVGSQLAAFLEDVPGADRPRDYEHLRRQQLVITTSEAGGWRARPEHRTDKRSEWARSVDVRLDRAARRETAIVEIWDWIDDVGAAARGLVAKVVAAEREHAIRELDGGERWRVAGLMVVRGTRRNRGLVSEFRSLFRSQYPASSRAWLDALTEPDASMPSEPGFLWTDVGGTRLLAARL